MEQLVTPDINAYYWHNEYDAAGNQTVHAYVQCYPGWCLEFGRTRINAPAIYNTAKDNWSASTTKHTDQDWPALWFPIWFDVVGVPAGHIAWHAPDHSIWSSSSPTATTPVHHASLSAMQFYWNNGKMLTYLGWTEDIANVKVIGGDMDKITKEQEQTLALMATDSYPGVDYNYQFTGQDLNQGNLDGMLQFWQGQSQIHTVLGELATANQTIATLQAQLETPPEPTEPASEPSVTPDPSVIPTSTKSTSLWDEVLNFIKGFFK